MQLLTALQLTQPSSASPAQSQGSIIYCILTSKCPHFSTIINHIWNVGLHIILCAGWNDDRWWVGFAQITVVDLLYLRWKQKHNSSYGYIMRFFFFISWPESSLVYNPIRIILLGLCHFASSVTVHSSFQIIWGRCICPHFFDIFFFGLSAV